MRQDAFVSLLEAALGERAALVEAYRGELRSAKGALRVELTCAGWLSPAEIAKIRKAIRLEIPELASVSLHPRCLAARESFARDCAAFEEDLFAFLYSSMPALQGMGESPRLQLEQDILRVRGASPAWQGVFHAQQGEQRLGQIIRQLFGLDVRVRVQDAETAGAQAANGGESASPVNDLPPGKATAQEEAKEVRTPIDDLPPWEAALQDDAKEIPPPEDDLPPWEAADAGAQKLLSPEDVSNPDIPARAQGEQDAPACPLPSAELLAKLPDFLPEAPVQAAQPAVDAPPADAPFAAPAAVSAPPGPAISSADYVFAKPEEGKYSAAGVGMPPDDKEAVVLGKPITTACVDISEIREEIPSVTFQGEIIEATDETFKNGSRAVVRMAVTDYTSTISVRLYCDGDRLSRYARMLTPGRHVRVQGKARTNTTPRGEVEVFVDVRHLTLLPTPKRTDDAPEKRVELHLHTQMSSMDGMTNLKKVVQTAHDWGHGALAITDHGVVQTYPDALALTKKYPDFKVIYGLEASWWTIRWSWWSKRTIGR